MLFYGPSGAGKKTRIAGTLRELFGAGTEKLKIDQRVFMTPSRRKLDLNIVQSNYHIEITPSDVGIYDRVVIQEILKEIAQTQQVDLGAKQRFKVVVINEADSLTRDAQAALRRTMEKYMANMRIILCSTSTSKLIAPIKSRCLLVRVGAPTDDEMTSVLQYVAKKERFTLSDEVASNIARDADGNTRKAVLMLEAMKMQHPNLSETTMSIQPAKPDWETYCHHVADMIVQEQTPKRVMDVRGKLYELLSHCIPPHVVLKVRDFSIAVRIPVLVIIGAMPETIAERVTDKVDESIKADIVHWAAFYVCPLLFISPASVTGANRMSD
ncbi:probable RFC5-DNA replication factor C, 40 KD subunit [Serendipita indica DSM 11827]|uniref:Probable RFC5-DNA replication factor C, 40 KD subunit n=1 Tax=Serendipita indica (strain DSM 11827) TaxID=1109443 RepID=G4T5P7_SERID|nr:probable RFC5-DNA replication factor C, 40 KD subunit [Serendipita indica DSM 11827]